MVVSQSSVADEFAIGNFIANGEGEWLYGPDGAEITVNSTYARSQAHSDVARLADGNFIVTWIDADFNTSAGRFLRAQVFAPDGTALGAELTLVSANVGTQPAVAGLAGGGYAVAWVALGSIRAQAFDANGAAVGTVVTVTPVGASSVGRPDIAALADGGFAIAWHDSRTTGGDVAGAGVHLRTFDAQGAAIGGDVLVNIATAGNQADAAITALAGGGHVVTWTDRGAGWVVKAQIFDGAGARVGGPFVVNAASGGTSVESSVTALAGGGFAVAWYESDEAGPAHRIQVFTAAGAPVGAQIVTPANHYGTAVGPVLAALSDGGFALAWTTNYEPMSDGSGRAVFVQVYDAAGAAAGAPLQVNSQTGGDQLDPSITALADGAFVVSWTDMNGAGADDDEVKAQVFTPQTSQPNERPIIVSNGGGTSASIDLDEGQTLVTTVVATDGDGPDPVTYAITGGWAAHLFVIDPVTGVLSFAAAPDYENPLEDSGNFYSVQVTASDGDLSSFQLVQIMVNNVNEGVTITSGAAVTAGENDPYVTQVTASDIDGDQPGFSLAGGADSALFGIDAATGHLFFLGAPDFELPLDADGDGVYEVIVRASDGALHDDLAIAVTVTDVNEAIAFVSNGGGDEAAVAVGENEGDVAVLLAADPDGTAPQYGIAGGADAALFELDSVTHTLRFVAPPDFETPGDADGDNVYEVIVSATDGEQFDYQTIRVTVGNVYEGLGFDAPSRAFAADENGVAVGTIAASGEAGLTIGYAIAGGADAHLFSIDSATGALAFIEAPDFELPADWNGDNVYDVLVSASDGVGPGAYQAVSVTVGNVDEGVEISSFGGEDMVWLDLAENEAPLIQVAALDEDGDAVTYAIAGGADSGLFAIDAETGALSFLAAPDFEAFADADGDNVYRVNVVATSGAFADTQAFAVAISNVNEALAITSNGGGASASVSIGENGLSVTNVTAIDLDGTSATYSIVGGADASRFTIDPQTGALRFVAAPDHEAPADADGDNVYSVVVQAGDGQYSDSQSLSVTVLNLRDGNNVTGTNGADSISGTSTNPALRTTNAEDTVYGRDGHDTILGLGGDDYLYGDAGNDVLTGGAGADRLSGGLGKDQFVYTSVGDSAPAAHDVITDFSRSQNDKISLSGIDANSAVGGNQAFTFIGTSAFSNVAGQLRYASSGGTTTIFADVNGDGVADFQIQLTAPVSLVGSDFVL